MTPEEKARLKIDQWFADAGWNVIDRSQLRADGTAFAVREGLLNHNLEADYLLMVSGKVIGVLEAKRADVDVTRPEVSAQVENYARSVTRQYSTFLPRHKPLPFLYKSNGNELYFRDYRDPESTYERVTNIHRPYDLIRMLGIEDTFAGLPRLERKGLRNCQYDAILNLERSFRDGQKRALIALATGVGKTFTACMASYRVLSYTPMRHILFLVDRNNLARQAESAFGQFRLTYNGDPFNTIYTVNRLKNNHSLDDSEVVVCTIQRLFSFLKGEEIMDNDNDDDNDPSEVELLSSDKLPRDYFDMVIIDECHRSIYGKWKAVLDYFSSAYFVGLTATPIPDTLAFFNKNCVLDYSLEQSIVDGVNVDGRVYRIKTKVTEKGGAIREGETTQRETRYTGETEEITYTENRNYTRDELNRSIVNPSQIKLILQTYKNKVYRDMFPDRERNIDFIPKTLIFALNERHANNIVKIAKAVFGKQKDPDFIQKITYSVENSNELIRSFNNDRSFRIAVTCTLVATGTDVPPIEVVMFMRDVQSEPLYVQMKGRGVRIIDDTKLRNVTPNAHSKDYFYIVDAVGVTEHPMQMSHPTPPIPPKMTIKAILEKITLGEIKDEYLRRLASVLSRLHYKSDRNQRDEFVRLAGVAMDTLAKNFYRALSDTTFPPFEDTNDQNSERKALVAPLAEYPEARNYILKLLAGFVETIKDGGDEILFAGFSKEEATSTTEAFKKYCEENPDRIEALRIIYNKTGEPINYAMLQDLKQKLKMENNRFTPTLLWNSYAIVCPEKVKAVNAGDEANALTNIIQLVRFAYEQITMLESAVGKANSLFNLWTGQAQRNLSEPQRQVIKEVFTYIATNGACTVMDISNDSEARAAQLVRAFGSPNEANDALTSLYRFVFVRQTA